MGLSFAPTSFRRASTFTSSLVGCFTSFVVAIDTIHAWELGTSSSPLNGTREAPFSDTPNLHWWNALVGGFKKQESDGMESETSSSIGRFFEQFETLPVERQQKLQLGAAFSRQQSGIHSAKSSRMSFEHMRDNISYDFKHGRIKHIAHWWCLSKNIPKMDELAMPEDFV